MFQFLHDHWFAVGATGLALYVTTAVVTTAVVVRKSGGVRASLSRVRKALLGN